jgi:hypothetical protein
MNIRRNLTSPRAVTTTIVVPAAITVALVFPAVLLSSRVPNPMAIHWNASGEPNGQGPWWVVTLIFLVLWCSAWFVLLSMRPTHRRETAASVYGIGALLVGVQMSSLLANLDRASWHDARHTPNLIVTLALTFLALAIGAAIGWVVSGPDAPPDHAGARDARPLPSAGLRPGERAVWAGAAHNRWMYLVSAAVVTLAVVFGRGGALFVAAVAVAVALLVCVHVDVVIGPAGITTAVGVIGWPRRRIGFDEVNAARVAHVVPLEYGGWGWRRRINRTAVVIRRGDALDLELRTGKRFVVTVDGAEQAAGVVNDYLANRPPQAA